MVLDGKSSKKYSVNSEVPQGPILGPTLFLLYINGIHDDFICNIAIYADDATLNSMCDQASVDWGRKWLVDSNAGKTQLVSFDWSNNTGAVDVKMEASIFEGKLSFKILGLSFSSKLD